jgi:hypothetical protein
MAGAAVLCGDVAEPLTDEWISELATAAGSATVDPGLRLVVQQVVHDDDGSTVAFAVRLADGRAELVAGRVDDPDVTFTQHRRTATAIAAGRLSAQAAFMAGDLQVGGDLRAVLGRTLDLTALDSIFAPARAGAAR